MEGNIYGYIYIITCDNNMKMYIGKHKYSDDELDPNYFCSSRNPEFWNDITEYGISNFRKEILQLCYSLEELNNYEKLLISYHRYKYGWDQIYNLADGGDGGWEYVNRYLESHPEIKKELNRKAVETRYRIGFFESLAFKDGIKKQIRTKRDSGFYESSSYKKFTDAAHTQTSRRKAEATMKSKGNFLSMQKFLWKHPTEDKTKVMDAGNAKRWLKGWINLGPITNITTDHSDND